ncbi:undecaprenyl-diphosphatase [Bacillus salitolerans]|uniref:Undecaprenyl-diphosphatase n=1 Tax=Bacillus salitolerans TaxID=1437434 RepID=A0ABW4LR59_9BACI
MNKRIFWCLNRFSGRMSSIDYLMVLLSNYSRYFYVIVILFLWIRGSNSKETSKNSMVSVAVAWVLNFIIGKTYYKPRPFIFHKVGLLSHSKRTSTFPSKHTILVFAVSTSIYLRNRILGRWMTCFSALVGFSRIWVGAHYPLDILGSALLGSIVSMMVNIQNKR